MEACPVISLSRKDARGEIEALLAGDPSVVLDRCQSCFACNFHCPNGARPASLVLQRWNEQYRREGLRARAAFFATHWPNYPNFRSRVVERMTDEERALLAKWARTDPLDGDTLAYPGCNVLATPTLVQSGLFDGLDFRGRLEYCCGEMAFRSGLFDHLRQVAKRLDKWFHHLAPRHLLVLCTACTDVIKNVLPGHGLTYQFESVTSYVDWLWRRIREGEVEVTRELGWKVALQDSCHAKMFGDAYLDAPREILRALGCEVVELPNCRENARCCGIGAGFSVSSSYHPFKLRAATAANIDDVKKTGADVLCAYCSGCNQMYHVARKLYFKRVPFETYHLIELVQLGIGETPRRMIGRTAKSMFRSMLRRLPSTWSRKRFELPPIPEDPDDRAY